MFDALSVVFWGITYILIVVYSIKNRKSKIRAISLLPPILNFSWELNALIVSQGFWGHIVWLTLDVFVVIACAAFIKGTKKQLLYMAALVPGALLFHVLFRINMGMLMSSFVIDLIMAVCFFVEKKKLLKDGMILIGITKLLGDLSAVIHYAPYSVIILIIGIIVFILNVAYLVYAIAERMRERKAAICKNE